MDKLTNLQKCYTYNDLLIKPIKSTINSRSDIRLHVKLFDDISFFDIPIISAPMNTVTEHKMAIKMFELGGLGILHRFCDIDYLKNQALIMSENILNEKCAFAIGCNEVDKSILEQIGGFFKIVCIDLNLGHHQKVIEMIRYVKKNYPYLKIIAGNVSTFDGAYDLCCAGADCIRATNGGGSACITLQVTGVGIPTATSLHECHRGVVKAQKDTGNMKTLIADGSIKNSGDIAKAIALGADAIMIGGLLAGSSCCPESAFFTENNEFRAKYSGMASEEAQIARFGRLKEGTAPEGQSFSIPPKGKTSKIIDTLISGLRSAFTFVNAIDIQSFKQNSEFVLK